VVDALEAATFASARTGARRAHGGRWPWRRCPWQIRSGRPSSSRPASLHDLQHDRRRCPGIGATGAQLSSRWAGGLVGLRPSRSE